MFIKIYYLNFTGLLKLRALLFTVITLIKSKIKSKASSSLVVKWTQWWLVVKDKNQIMRDIAIMKTWNDRCDCWRVWALTWKSGGHFLSGYHHWEGSTNSSHRHMMSMQSELKATVLDLVAYDCHTKHVLLTWRDMKIWLTHCLFCLTSKQAWCSLMIIPLFGWRCMLHNVWTVSHFSI